MRVKTEDIDINNTSIESFRKLQQIRRLLLNISLDYDSCGRLKQESATLCREIDSWIDMYKK